MIYSKDVIYEGANSWNMLLSHSSESLSEGSLIRWKVSVQALFHAERSQARRPIRFKGGDE